MIEIQDPESKKCVCVCVENISVLEMLLKISIHLPFRSACSIFFLQAPSGTNFYVIVSWSNNRVLYFVSSWVLLVPLPVKYENFSFLFSSERYEFYQKQCKSKRKFHSIITMQRQNSEQFANLFRRWVGNLTLNQKTGSSHFLGLLQAHNIQNRWCNITQNTLICLLKRPALGRVCHNEWYFVGCVGCLRFAIGKFHFLGVTKTKCC